MRKSYKKKRYRVYRKYKRVPKKDPVAEIVWDVLSLIVRSVVLLLKTLVRSLYSNIRLSRKVIKGELLSPELSSYYERLIDERDSYIKSLVLP